MKKESNGNTAGKIIEPTGTLKPLQVHKSISGTVGTGTYEVSPAGDADIQNKMILRSFNRSDGGYGAQLHNYHRRLSGTDADRYIPELNAWTSDDGTDWMLYSTFHNTLLTVEWIKAFTLEERLKKLADIAWCMAAFRHAGFYFTRFKPEYLCVTENGTIKLWNLDGIGLLDDAPQEQTAHLHNSGVAMLGQLLLDSILDKELESRDMDGDAFEDSDFANEITSALCSKMAAPELTELLHILRKFLTAHKSEYYQSMDELAEELYDLTDHMARNVHNPRAVQNVFWSAADFLDRNPLYRYVRRMENGEKVLSIAMIGEAPVRDSFFELIFSSAQMLDTQLRFHVISPAADEFELKYYYEAPTIYRTARITRIGIEALCDLPEHLDADIVGDNAPFAEIILEKCRELPDAQKLLDHGCVFLFGKSTHNSRNLIQQLVGRCEEPLLIACASQRNMDQNGIGKRNNIDIRTFSCSGTFISEEEKRNTAIYAKALKVHSGYKKDFDERISRTDILADFEDPYNVRSSLRSAISAAYKLHACGLDNCEDSAIPFRERVLVNGGDEKLMDRLIWLEHRSYQAFLIINGWDLMDDKTFETHLFHPDNPNHGHQIRRQNAPNLHLCLYASRDNYEAPALDKWSYADWDSGDVMELDPLDRISVKRYRMFDERVRTVSEATLRAAVESIPAEAPAAPQKLFFQMRLILPRLLSRDIKASISWKRCMQELRQYIPDALTKTLNEHADVVIQRNQRRNFKQSDRAVIEAIPWLLVREKITTVYKLYTDQAWENIASSVFIEPENLILVTDDEHTLEAKQLQHYERFLKELRKLDITVRKIRIEELSCEESDNLLDVTGATARQLLMAQRNDVLRHLPAIEYRNGRLINVDDRYPQICFYNHNRNLTIAETMAITGASVFEQSENVLMQADQDSVMLWDTMHRINAIDPKLYNYFTGWLKELNFGDRIQYKYPDNRPYYLPRITLDQAIQCGLYDFMEKLASNNLIKKLPNLNNPAAWTGGLKIHAANQNYQKYINDIVKAAAAQAKPVQNYKNRYQLLPVCSISNPDRRSWLVRDTFLEIDQTLSINSKEKVELDKKSVSVAQLIKALEYLQQSGLIVPVRKNPNVWERMGQKFSIQFAFRDMVARDLLSKEGNILEAMAYHAIREADLFDDVQIGVNVLWEDVPGCPDETINEIDIIGTKGVRTYFISCKKTVDIANSALTEVRYEADRFGVNGTAILLTTAQEKDKPIPFSRARRMGVHVISISEDTHANSEKQIIAALKKIISKTEQN